MVTKIGAYTKKHA
uniref:Uncharacterized protein n=1 Tax=Arundo donax TaxID=35708 RepID=A0A0A9FI81_ARUDO